MDVTLQPLAPYHAPRVCEWADVIGWSPLTAGAPLILLVSHRLMFFIAVYFEVQLKHLIAKFTWFLLGVFFFPSNMKESKTKIGEETWLKLHI